MKNRRYLRLLCFTLLLITALVFAGCKKKEAITIDPTEPTESELVTEPSETEVPETEPIDEDSIELSEETAVYEENNINISYPVISGFIDESRQDSVNSLIKDFATAFLNNEEEEDISAAVNYQIISLDRQTLSVLFTGEKTVAGKTSDLEYYLTMDMRNGVTKRLFHYVDPYQLGEMILNSEGVGIVSDNSHLRSQIYNYLMEITPEEYEELFKIADFDQNDSSYFPLITSHDANGDIFFTFPLPDNLGGYALLAFTPDTK